MKGKIIKYGGLLLIAVGVLLFAVNKARLNPASGIGGILAAIGVFLWKTGKNQENAEELLDGFEKERIVLSKDIRHDFASVIDLIVRKCPDTNIYAGQCECDCQFLYSTIDISYETGADPDTVEPVVRCPACHKQLIHDPSTIVRQ